MAEMTTVCPSNVSPAFRTGDVEDCVCLPIRAVEQDILAGISPFGLSYSGCVSIPSSLVMLLNILHPTTTISPIPLTTPMNMEVMADKWKINEFVSGAVARKRNKLEMKVELMKGMEEEIMHEQMFEKRGHITKFVRSTEKTEEIGHNYMIMRSLQTAAENSKF